MPLARGGALSARCVTGFRATGCGNAEGGLLNERLSPQCYPIRPICETRKASWSELRGGTEAGPGPNRPY
jgi:hypothetical protein